MFLCMRALFLAREFYIIVCGMDQLYKKLLLIDFCGVIYYL